MHQIRVGRQSPRTSPCVCKPTETHALSLRTSHYNNSDHTTVSQVTLSTTLQHGCRNRVPGRQCAQGGGCHVEGCGGMRPRIEGHFLPVLGKSIAHERRARKKVSHRVIFLLSIIGVCATKRTECDARCICFWRQIVNNTVGIVYLLNQTLICFECLGRCSYSQAPEFVRPRRLVLSRTTP